MVWDSGFRFRGLTAEKNLLDLNISAPACNKQWWWIRTDKNAATSEDGGVQLLQDGDEDDGDGSWQVMIRVESAHDHITAKRMMNFRMLISAERPKSANAGCILPASILPSTKKSSSRLCLFLFSVILVPVAMTMIAMMTMNKYVSTTMTTMTTTTPIPITKTNLTIAEVG